MQVINQVSQAEVDALVAEYDTNYQVVEALQAGGAKRDSLVEAARIELGQRNS